MNRHPPSGTGIHLWKREDEGEEKKKKRAAAEAAAMWRSPFFSFWGPVDNLFSSAELTHPQKKRIKERKKKKPTQYDDG